MCFPLFSFCLYRLSDIRETDRREAGSNKCVGLWVKVRYEGYLACCGELLRDIETDTDDKFIETVNEFTLSESDSTNEWEDITDNAVEILPVFQVHAA